MKKKHNIEFALPDKSLADLTPISFNQRQPKMKKYILHRMNTQKQEIKQINKVKLNKNPTYFKDMIKQQKKKQHVNTFVKKLKNSIQLRKPSQRNSQFLQKCQIEKTQIRNLFVQKPLYFGILILLAIQNIILLIVNSIEIMFIEVDQQAQFKWYMTFSLVMHLLTIITKTFYLFDYEENKKYSAMEILYLTFEVEQKSHNKLHQIVYDIKRNFNLQEEQSFLNRLPLNFKNQLFKQMYRPLWNGMTFFQNLSQKVLLELSISIEKKLTHPQQIVYSNGNNIQIMIFGKGKFGFTYKNGKSKRNGQIIHQFNIGADQFKLSTLDFLTEKALPYDIKCLDYSLFYTISFDKFLSIMKQSEYDYEYYFMVKDKDKYLINEFQLIKCQFCPNQRHTLFKCTKCHYLPFKKHIIDKHRLKLKRDYKIFLQNEQRKSKNVFKPLKIIKQNVIDLNKVRTEVHNQINSLNVSSSSSLNQSLCLLKTNKPVNMMIQGQNSIFQENYIALQSALSKVQNNIKNEIMQKKQFWQVQSDKVNNFKFYFKRFNAQELVTKKKTQKTRNNFNFKTIFLTRK